MLVKSNIDYQIVAVFITENEREDNIQEALSVIKSWNKIVSPMYGIQIIVLRNLKSWNIFEGTLNENDFNVTSLLHLKDRLLCGIYF